MDGVQIDILNSEITSDPLARGYSGMSDEEVTVSLNTVDRTCTVSTVTGAAIFNATNDLEFGALTAENKDRWVQLCQIGEIDISSGIAKALEADIFGEATTTRANLQSLKSPECSRAAELGLGTVKPGHVEEARRL